MKKFNLNVGEQKDQKIQDSKPKKDKEQIFIKNDNH